MLFRSSIYSEDDRHSHRQQEQEQEQEQEHHVELVFCNPDLLWGSDFPAARIGQGAFKLAFQSVYKVFVSFRFVLFLSIDPVVGNDRYILIGSNRIRVSLHSIWETYSSDISFRGASSSRAGNRVE